MVWAQEEAGGLTVKATGFAGGHLSLCSSLARITRYPTAGTEPLSALLFPKL